MNWVQQMPCDPTIAEETHDQNLVGSVTQAK
jgi:hypothetical protein